MIVSRPLAALLCSATTLGAFVACSSSSPTPPPAGNDGGTVGKKDANSGLDLAALQTAVQIFVDANKTRAARCEPASGAATVARVLNAPLLVEKLSAPGITDAMRDAFDACGRTLASAPCNGGTDTEECFFYDNLSGTLLEGSACGFGQQCASGVCSASSTHCGVCLAGLGEGENCGGLNVNRCGAGLECIQGANVVSTCVRRRLVGENEQCNPAQRCRIGLSCDHDASKGAAYCRLPAGPGESCASDTSTPRACTPGGTYGCSDTTKTCIKRPGVGEACSTGGADTSLMRCAAGLVCSGSTLTCRQPKFFVEPKQPCSDGDSCEAGSSCSGPAYRPDGGASEMSLTCIKDLPLGAVCDGTLELLGECEEGLRCDTKTERCAPRIAPSSCN